MRKIFSLFLLFFALVPEYCIALTGSHSVKHPFTESEEWKNWKTLSQGVETRLPPFDLSSLFVTQRATCLVVEKVKSLLLKKKSLIQTHKN